MKDKEYPCEECVIRKSYANTRLHWHDHKDCLYKNWCSRFEAKWSEIERKLEMLEDSDNETQEYDT